MSRRYIPADARLVPPHAERVFQGVIYSVWQWQQELFDGSYTTFEMLSRDDTVEILAVIDGKLLVQNEEQPGRKQFVDIPGGRHDNEDEDELACAKRELLEETGYSLSDWRLVACQQFDSKTERFFYLFVASGTAIKTTPNLDPGERIATKLVDFTTFKEIAPTLRSYGSFDQILAPLQSVEELLQVPELYKFS